METVFPDLVSEVKGFKPTMRNDSMFVKKNGKMVPNPVAAGNAQSAPGDTAETFKSVNYLALIPVLVAALQEQQKEIEALKKGKNYGKQGMTKRNNRKTHI